MNVNKQIDKFLKIRRESLDHLEKAIKGLYEMGVRFFTPSPDGVPDISAAQNLLPRFELTLEDFEWKAIYNDKTELDQYGETQSHFGDIDMSKLDKIQYISNFEIATQNPEKRLVVTLNFEDGSFNFWNCGDQKAKDELSKKVEGKKKLILFKRKRESFTAGISTKTSKAEIMPTGDKFTYTRYYLGYECGKKKVIVCLYPNGQMSIENDAKKGRSKKVSA